MTSTSHNQSLLDYNNNNNINNINNISKSLEYEKLIQENVTLKSDNLIFREDIKHLTEVNHNLEKELELSRKKILELVNQNDTLDQHISQKCLEIDKLTQAITRLRLFDNPDMEFVIDNRKNKDQKIRELEFDYKTLNEDKIKIQTEYKIMMERFNEFKKQNEDLEQQLAFVKLRESEQIANLERKIANLEKQLDYVGKENTSLRMTDERFRRELAQVNKEKEKLEEKYIKKKQELNEMKLKCNEYEFQVRKIQNEKLDESRRTEEERLKREMTSHKNNNGEKQKVFEDLHRKIQFFKQQMINKRNNSPLQNNSVINNNNFNISGNMLNKSGNSGFGEYLN
jgi:chromosome segregation ATPase